LTLLAAGGVDHEGRAREQRKGDARDGDPDRGEVEEKSNCSAEEQQDDEERWQRENAEDASRRDLAERFQVSLGLRQQGVELGEDFMARPRRLRRNRGQRGRNQAPESAIAGKGAPHTVLQAPEAPELLGEGAVEFGDLLLKLLRFLRLPALGAEVAHLEITHKSLLALARLLLDRLQRGPEGRLDLLLPAHPLFFQRLRLFGPCAFRLGDLGFVPAFRLGTRLARSPAGRGAAGRDLALELFFPLRKGRDGLLQGFEQFQASVGAEVEGAIHNRFLPFVRPSPAHQSPRRPAP